MAAAADPYVEWINTTAAQAELTASQAWAAAAAFEAAFAATVPPPIVAANRATLAVLVATNFFGQNAPAIAANEVEYGEMWAQDAAAMYSYTGSSVAAIKLIPPSAAPQTTNPAGSAGQAAAVQAAAATSAHAGSSILDFDPFGAIASSPLINNATMKGLDGVFNAFGPLLLQVGGVQWATETVQLLIFPLYLTSGKLAMLGPSAAMGAATGADLASSTSADTSAATLAGAHEPDVSAGLGRAVPLGKLSVPPSWGVATQEVRLTAAELPAASPLTPPSAGMAPPSAGMAPPFMGGPVGSMVNTPKNADTRARSGVTNADEAIQNRWARGAFAPVSGLSEREQDELYRLREELADLAMDYDAMARLMREAMR